MTSCNSCTNNSSNALIPSLQTAVTSIYHTRSSTNKELTIKITWFATPNGPSFSLTINDMLVFYADDTSGSSYYHIDHSALGIFWDFSSAQYSLSPEPVSDFYMAICLDNEFVLLEGDRASEFVEDFGGIAYSMIAEFCMVSRIIQVLGRVIVLNNVWFYDGGEEHDVVIRFYGKGEEMSMIVCVDEEQVLGVTRLGWNFRGSEKVVVEGMEVEIMWDIFRLLFENPHGWAVVMFRTTDNGEVFGGGSSLLVQVRS